MCGTLSQDLIAIELQGKTWQKWGIRAAWRAISRHQL